MIYQYVVVLKNQHSRYINLLGFLLGLLSIVFFVKELLEPGQTGFVYLIGVIFIVGVLAWNVYHSVYKGKKVYYSRALLIAALVWMKMPYFQWLSFVFIILALLEYQAKYAVEIGFADNEIKFNTLLKKKYSWSDFTNIVLKDGLLTLDFANNKILQREIEDDDDEDDADEQEFNEYCRRQLAKSFSNISTRSLRQ
ncbi:MAG: hypothetical protein H7122_00980 [Chitinophagaceae bacterium]|nr:hypothetical protein [Chitinophagaceae bacterium]